jgi:two-component system CheB/CheR fusion protein
MQSIAATQDTIESLLRLLVDQAAEHAILLMDVNGTVIWGNAGASRILNSAREALIGQPLSSIFTTQDREKGIDRLEVTIASTSAVSEDDRWHVRSDGSKFWSSGALLALRAADGNIVGYGKILRDRTDTKERLELLNNTVAELQASNESKDLAITKISHELRNVFAGINMGLQMISTRGRGSVEPDIAHLMRQQLNVVERLTEDLLDAKRLCNAKVSLSLGDIDLQQLLQDVIEQFHARIIEKSLHVQLLSPPAAVLVPGDRIRLQQIFGNLIDNAIKYTPANGNIWVKLTVEDEQAVIHLEDNGKGIPPQMLSEIFRMFTQVDPNSSSRGLGLGLALVHELVLLHGGSVQATSKGLGMGSEFTVRLPVSDLSRPIAL